MRLLMPVIALLVIDCGPSRQVLTAYNQFDFAVAPQAAPDLAHATTETSPPDMATAPVVDLAMSTLAPDLTPTAVGCTSYSKSTIATMREAATSGCFELDDVVVIAVTPVTASSTSVRILVQDAAGGDYSAIVLNCYDSATTRYPCTSFPTAKNILSGRAVTVSGYYEKAAAANGAYEDLAIDSISDTGSGTAPAPASVTLSQIERSADATSKWFQNVTLTIAAADKLEMYDFTPPEFLSTSTSSSCTHVYGLGMLPKSATGTPAAACSGTTTQPAGQTAVNASEVLIGSDFYGGFTANSECTCVSTKTNKPYAGLVSATSTLSGTVSGILFYDAYTSTGYQYLSPLTNAGAPITNLSM